MESTATVLASQSVESKSELSIMKEKFVNFENIIQSKNELNESLKSANQILNKKIEEKEDEIKKININKEESTQQYKQSKLQLTLFDEKIKEKENLIQKSEEKLKQGKK
jgi:hypothetical protein